MYVLLYYFGYDVKVLDVEVMMKSFYIEVRKFGKFFFKVRGVFVDEFLREWMLIGWISMVIILEEIIIREGYKVYVYNKFGVDFWVVEVRMGYYYYVYMSYEVKVFSERDFFKNF